MSFINNNDFPSLAKSNSRIRSSTSKQNALGANLKNASNSSSGLITYSDKLKGSKNDFDFFLRKDCNVHNEPTVNINRVHCDTKSSIQKDEAENERSGNCSRHSHKALFVEHFPTIKQKDSKSQSTNFVNRENNAEASNSNCHQESISVHKNSNVKAEWNKVVYKNHRTSEKHAGSQNTTSNSDQTPRLARTKNNQTQFNKSDDSRDYPKIAHTAEHVTTKLKTSSRHHDQSILRPNRSNNSNEMKQKGSENTHPNIHAQKDSSNTNYAGTSQEIVAKKKKKRPNKIKRQTAFQTGKLMILTPELHSHILNQMSNSTSVYSKSKSAQQSGKKIFCDSEQTTSFSGNTSEQSTNETSTSNPAGCQTVAKSFLLSSSALYNGVKEDVSPPINPKTKVCPREPIQLFDLLNSSKPRVIPKSIDKEITVGEITSPKKIIKPNPNSHAANTLDASAPVKRGKEREKPRVKKPTALKKIILQEREERKKLKNAQENPLFDTDAIQQSELLQACDENRLKNCDSLKGNIPEVSSRIKSYKQTDLSSTTTASDVFEQNNLSNTIATNFDLSIIRNDSTNNASNGIIPSIKLSNNIVRDQDDTQVTYTADLSVKVEEQMLLKCAIQFADICVEQCINGAFDILSNYFSVKFKSQNSLNTNDSLKMEEIETSALYFSVENQSVEEQIAKLQTMQSEIVKPVIVHHENEPNCNEKCLFEPFPFNNNCDLKDFDCLDMVNEIKVISNDNVKETTNDLINIAVNSTATIQTDAKIEDGFSFKLPDEQTLDRISFAVKIALHTKSFRPYCNHFLRNELNECVLTLISDLRRFQDRLHQKDPVKAHMKRRLIFGIREVMKYVKLRKLKCVIIAPNLEDIKSKGGLNDTLISLIRLCYEYHAPCIFSIDRKQLGIVCHKPVPVSCIGIFNYEGSEINFKKAQELLQESLNDYKVVSKFLKETLCYNDVEDLIQASEAAPQNLLLVRKRILRNVFENTTGKLAFNSLQELTSKYIVKI